MIEWNIEWTPVLAVAGALGLLLLIWSYTRRVPSALKGSAQWLALGLKLLGFALLIIYLLEPRQTKNRVAPGENTFVVLSDNSASMSLRDSEDSLSRGEILNQLLLDGTQPNGSGWRDRLEQWFEIRDYSFGNRLETVDSVVDLDFDAKATPLLGSLARLGSRFKSRDLAGILLLSDGAATDVRMENQMDWKDLPPVYTAMIGSTPTAPDIAIENVQVSQTVFEDAPVNVKVTGRVYGDIKSTIHVELLDSSGRVVESQEIAPSSAEPAWISRFALQPDLSLAPFYHVRAYSKALGDPRVLYDLSAPPIQEATYWNNVSLFAVNPPEGPYRILYISGRPNWEFKFLNRALDEDPVVQLSALIRVAKREPKFEFRGGAGNNANPLFQGLNDPAVAEARRYDEPVLTRVNVMSEEELKDGFPDFKTDLYKYHALILDDVEAEFFTRDQLYLIRDFVSRRGGGFLMLGGQESFAKGRYAGTPIEDILPFYLTRSSRESAVPTGATEWLFTEEGWQESWSRTQETQEEEQKWLAFSPEWSNFNLVGRPKPGASLLAVLKDERGQRFPALGIQKYGLGRSAALTLARFWRTQFRTPLEDTGFEKRWRQLARWLTIDAPSRLRVEIDEENAGGVAGMQTIRSLTFNKEFEPETAAQLTVKVTEYQFDQGKFVKNSERDGWNIPTQNGSAPHEKTASYLPGGLGGFVVEAEALDQNGAEIGRIKSRWVSNSMSEELANLNPNPDLLQRISRNTKGRMINIDEIAAWAEEMESAPAPRSISYSVPLWHGPWPLIAALICFLLEWRIRRRRMAA